jgi:hypothetical protein
LVEQKKKEILQKAQKFEKNLNLTVIEKKSKKQDF